ncbi:MAG TPA: cation:proton antiporter [Acidimicrobiia bacterium]
MRETALAFLELGGIILLLAVLARIAVRMGLSPIPLYLLGGLAIGEGGIFPVVTSDRFIETGAELGVVLLLLMLGLEYTGDELVQSLRSSSAAGLVDLAANFTPGFVAGLLLGIGPLPSLFLGGVTYISSSGVAAKVLSDLGWMANRETPIVLSILVFEDLAVAIILPVLAAAALGGSFASVVGSVTAALLAVTVIITASARYGNHLSRAVFSGSDEASLLALLGITLLVAGAAEQLNVSAAVGAFLVGIGISGEATHRARRLLSPLRDVFAGVFFVFFGLSTDPAELPGVALPVLALALVTGASKVLTGWWASRRHGIGPRGRWRTGAVLISRGEFSIVIAGLGVAAGGGSILSAVAAGYVLLMASLGPIAARLAQSAGARDSRDVAAI